MEYVIFAALITAIGVSIFHIRRKKKRQPPPPATFTCPHCGEKDCHCELNS